MSFEAISKDRWDDAWAGDLDVLQNLRRNGDDPTLPRAVDVSFRGSVDALRRLSRACQNFGFEVQSFEESSEEDGQPWLFLVRTQAVDEEAMRNFTATYLLIEDSFGVTSDGWGCIAQNGR